MYRSPGRPAPRRGEHEVDRGQQHEHQRAAGEEHRAPAPQVDEEAGADRPEREAGVDRADRDAVSPSAALGRHGVGDDRRAGGLHRGRGDALHEAQGEDRWHRGHEADGERRKRERDHAELVERRLVGGVAEASRGEQQRDARREEHRLDQAQRRGAGGEVGAERRQRDRDARDHERRRELRRGDRGHEEGMGMGGRPVHRSRELCSRMAACRAAF